MTSGGTVTFPDVFTPLRIGSVTVRNRLFVSAHSTQFVVDDPEGYHRWSVLGDRARAYHEERAKGGFGLLIIGQTQVHPQSGTERPGSFTKQAVGAYRSIADACHRHGAKVFVQLAQQGWERVYSGPDAWAPVWSASPLASPQAKARGEMCKAMDADDIRELVDGFRRSAANCQEAGMDGLEIHAAHPHLLGEWLTPAYNKRSDRYGGSLEKRVTLLIEILEAVRAECDPAYTVGFRMNGEWTFPGGQTVDEAREIAHLLAMTNQVDFLDVAGWPGIGNIGSPLGNMIPWAEAVKEVTPDLPVFGIGRVITVEQAQAILQQGSLDMVGMTRASIADPELPNKALEGRNADVRVCVGAGQGCLKNNILGAPMTCQQNPAVGREATWGIGTMGRAAGTRRVVVVGGGPAGLEASYVAAERGHDVTLFESGDELGGQLRLITRVARRAEYTAMVTWRERQLRRRGVDVRLGAPARAADVLALAPDAVVLATGSTARRVGWYPPLPHLDALPGSDQDHVFTVWDVLGDALSGCSHVVVIDATGYYQSADALEYLANRGIRTTAVSHLPLFAVGIDDNDRPDFEESVNRSGSVEFRCSTLATGIGPSSVSARDLLHGRDTTIDGVDAVVVSIGNDTVDSLYSELRGAVPQVDRIGDCVAPRRIEQAVFEGHQIGRAL